MYKRLLRLTGETTTNWFSVRHKRKEISKFMSQPKPRDIFAPHSKPDAYKIYKVLTLFLGLPLIIAGAVTMILYGEEKKREPFVPYTYLRIRHKKFPWGDGNHSFFHNPKYNALPDGYETPDEPEE